MTFVQNQGSDVRINVLHDQGVPNTLGGVTIPVVANHFRAVGYALTLFVFVLLVVFLVIRPI
jgi:hypothetical protein